jgi:hypothetical protein
MNVLKINIAKWIEKEIAQTEYQLLRAEDEAADAALRVKALQQRIARLKGKQTKQTKRTQGMSPALGAGFGNVAEDTGAPYAVPRRARLSVWPIKNFGGNKS